MVTDHTGTPTLTGTLYGATREELLTSAGAKGAEYFGTACVSVILTNETPHPMMSGFNASFQAREHHDLEHRSYGPDKCRGCGGSSWPSRPLTQANWSKK